VFGIRPGGQIPVSCLQRDPDGLGYCKWGRAFCF